MRGNDSYRRDGLFPTGSDRDAAKNSRPALRPMADARSVGRAPASTREVSSSSSISGTVPMMPDVRIGRHRPQLATPQHQAFDLDRHRPSPTAKRRITAAAGRPHAADKYDIKPPDIANSTVGTVDGRRHPLASA